jgi:hypothetical protein
VITEAGVNVNGAPSVVNEIWNSAFLLLWLLLLFPCEIATGKESAG